MSEQRTMPEKHEHYWMLGSNPKTAWLECHYCDEALEIFEMETENTALKKRIVTLGEMYDKALERVAQQGQRIKELEELLLWVSDWHLADDNEEDLELGQKLVEIAQALAGIDK